MKNLQFYCKLCKALLFVSILLISHNSNAQIMRGTSVISGDLSASYSTDEWTDGTAKYLDFSLIPSFGYFLADNFQLNIALEVNYSTSKTPYMNLGENKDETLSYYFVPSVKFYKAVTDKFYFNLGIFFRYGMRDTKYTPYFGTETKRNFSTIGMGIQPGFTYFVTDKIAFTSSLGTIGYTLINNKTDDKKSGGFGFNFGLNSLYFGLSFYLPKKI